MPLALKWGADSGNSNSQGLMRVLEVLTSAPARVVGTALGSLAASAGQLVKGGVADVCVFDPQAEWTPAPAALRSQGKHTPFSSHLLSGKVRCTLVGGVLAFEAAA